MPISAIKTRNLTSRFNDFRGELRSMLHPGTLISNNRVVSDLTLKHPLGAVPISVVAGLSALHSRDVRCGARHEWLSGIYSPYQYSQRVAFVIRRAVPTVSPTTKFLQSRTTRVLPPRARAESAKKFLARVPDILIFEKTDLGAGQLKR